MNKIVAALLAACCAASAQAQTVGGVAASPPPTVFTLNAALQAAEGSSPVGEAADAGVDAARAGRIVAALRPNPTAGLEVENVLGSGAYSGTGQVETTGTLEWPIELGGKRASRISVADAELRRSSIEAAILRADLRLAVAESYIEAIASEQRLATAREQDRIAAEGLRVAAVRVRAGRASPIEVQRAEVAQINAVAGLRKAERDVEVSRLRLARRIGRPTGGALDAAWFAQIASVYGPAVPVDGQGTLALAAASADLATADAQVRLAQSQRLPDLTAGLGGRRFENGDAALLFSVTVPLPVLNTGRAAIELASAQRFRAEAQRRVTAVEVADAILQAQAEVANAGSAAATAAGPALEAAEETARIARIGYREGKFGQLDLLDAERTLAETHRAATDALAAYHTAQARLARLVTPAPVEGN